MKKENEKKIPSIRRSRGGMAVSTDVKAGPRIGNFNFKVEIDGVTVAAFKNVEGLDSTTE